MKIKVKVHANSSQEKIKNISALEYEIWIKEKPINGKANFSLIKILKKHFNKNPRLVSGFNSNTKIFDLE